MKRYLTLALATTALAVTCMVRPVHAGNAAASWYIDKHLSHTESVRLKTLIQQDRDTRPSAYAEVAGIKQRLPAMQHPGRFPPVSRQLKRLGSRAKLPLLAEVVSPSRDAGMSDHLWLAWRIGVVEAVGELRDAEASTLLLASLKASVEPELATTAASAYAKLGTEEVAATLVSLSKPDQKARVAVLAGMGHCRRLVVAQALASALESSQDAQLLLAIIRSLGTIGSLWVWRGGNVPAPSDAAAVRSTAAKALVHAYGKSHEASVTRGIEEALLVIAEPKSFDFIASEQKNVSAEVVERFEHLALRLANNRIQ